MTVREHIVKNLVNLSKSGLSTFKTSDIQELSYTGKNNFGTDGVIKVKKLDRKNRQQVWHLQEIQF